MSKFWATWKLRIIAGVAIIAALAIAIFAAHRVGYTKGEAISKVEIQRYETRIRELQNKVVTKIVKGDDKIITKYIETVRYQDRIVYQNRDIIKTVVVDRPVNVSQGWVHAHNQSALMKAIDPSEAAQSAPSTFNDSTILLKITDNYAKANQCIVTLEALQAIVAEREKILAKK